MKKVLKVAWPPLLYFVLQNVFVLILFFITFLVPLLINSANISIFEDPKNIIDLVNQVAMPGMLINALVCIFVFGIVYYRKEAVYLNCKPFGASGFSVTVFGALGCYTVSNIIAALLQPIFGGNETLENAIMSGGYLINIITVGIAVPIVEEILFRGIMFNRLRRYLGSTPAIFVSAAIFGVVHFSIVQSIYAGIIGIYLAYLVEKYNTIKAPIIAHIIINSLSIVLYYIIGG